MTTTYYMSGTGFPATLTKTAPGASTISVSVPTNTTETDDSIAASDDPGTNGSTGDYSVTLEITTGNADLEISCQIHRCNSGGTPQSSSSLSSEQNGASGPLTFNFTSLDLGTWASGDRLRVDFQLRDTTIHGNEAFTYTIGSSGTRVVAPWSAGSAVSLTGTSAGAATTSGDTTVNRGLDSSPAGSATTSGNTTVDRGLNVSPAGSATTSGSISVAIPLSGSSVGVATTSANMTESLALSSSADGVATTVGTLTVTGSVTALDGASAGVATTSGDATVDRGLNVADSAIATTSGDATIDRGLTGADSAISTTSAQMSESLALAGTTPGQSSETGDLSLTVGLSATCQAQGSAAATLSKEIPIDGADSATTTTTGDLTVILLTYLDAAVAALATSSGSLTITEPPPDAIYPVQECVWRVFSNKVSYDDLLDAVDNGEITPWDYVGGYPVFTRESLIEWQEHYKPFLRSLRRIYGPG